jgi:hypothetical protein
MTLDLQRGLTIALVLLAVVYLSRRSWRHWRAISGARRTSGCGPGCGCG